jgi:hypothetical protein
LARTNTAVTLIGRLSVWLVCLAISKAKWVRHPRRRILKLLCQWIWLSWLHVLTHL